jgi:hypothetical protein
MRYVMQYGHLFKLSERMFRRLMRDGMNGNIAGNWEYYGAKLLATDVESITDWTEDDYEFAYNNHVDESKRKSIQDGCRICGGTEHADPLPGTEGRRCVKCCNTRHFNQLTPGRRA